MIALATIADQSTTADGVRGWLFVAAVIIIGGTVTAILAARWNLSNVPVMGDELSNLDRADGIDRPRCHLRCGLPAFVVRQERADLGGQLVNVCIGHADEGTVKGWWAA